MEFGKHLGKGLWGLAGRALPTVYGLGIIVFVIRVFPPVEFGVFALLQTILVLVTTTGQSFALQPLVKFGAEADDPAGPLSASALLYALFILAVTVVLLPAAGILGVLFQSGEAGALMYYVPLTLAATFPRNVASFLLQSKLRLKTLFFLDALQYLGSMALVAFLVPAGVVVTAEDLMRVNLVAALLSTVYGLTFVVPVVRLTSFPGRRFLRQVWDYGKYSFASSLSYTLYANSDNLIIASVLGPVSLAIYSAAKAFVRLFEMGMQVIALLLVPTVSRMQARSDAGALVVLAEKSLFTFSTLMIAAAGGVYFFGPPLMDLVYGGRYPESGSLLRVLAFSGLFIAGIAVSSSFCFGLGKMREVFYINFSMSAFGIALTWLLTAGFGLSGSAWAVVLSYAAMMVVWLSALVAITPVRPSFRGVLLRYRDPINYLRKILTAES